jgi:hypothetical protein
MHLPFWLIELGLFGKGRDCAFRYAPHSWYNLDNLNSACYYCRVIKTGQLWRPSHLRELDVVRVTQIKDPSSKARELEPGQQPPRVGDEGTIVALFDNGVSVLVENGASDGSANWLVTFDHDELQVIA